MKFITLHDLKGQPVDVIAAWVMYIRQPLAGEYYTGGTVVVLSGDQICVQEDQAAIRAALEAV